MKASNLHCLFLYLIVIFKSFFPPGPWFSPECFCVPSPIPGTFIASLETFLWIPLGGGEKATAPHSSTLAWKIPWMENPMVGCSPWGPKSRTRLSDFTFTFHFHALEKEMATHSSVLAWRIPGTGGAWWAAVHRVAQNQTRLKQLSSSSSSQAMMQALGGKDKKMDSLYSCLENPMDGGAW